ncbi:hypothetical protein QYM36_008510, partial [Artemia franciscana]
IRSICGEPKYTDQFINKSNKLLESEETISYDNDETGMNSNVLQEVLQGLLLTVSESKGYYANVADLLCSGKNEELPPSEEDSNCWNGWEVGEYSKTIGGIGITEQKYNPEMKFQETNATAIVADLNRKLQTARQMLASKLFTSQDMDTFLLSDQGSGSGYDDDDGSFHDRTVHAGRYHRPGEIDDDDFEGSSGSGDGLRKAIDDEYEDITQDYLLAIICAKLKWCNFRSQQFKFFKFGKELALRVAVLSAFGRANNLIQWIKSFSVVLNIIGINRQHVLTSGVFKSFKSFLLIMLLLKAGLADGIRIANEIENILNPWLSIEQYLVLNTQTMMPGIRDKCLPSVPKPACDANKLNCQRHVRHAHSKLDSSSAYPNLSRNDCVSFLYGSHKDCICHASKGTQRIAALRKYKLFHCYNYNLWDVLDNKAKKGILEDSDLCLRYLSAIEALDATAGALVCEFEELMVRYDCSQTFSTMSNCDQCKAKNEYSTTEIPAVESTEAKKWPLLAKRGQRMN